MLRPALFLLALLFAQAARAQPVDFDQALEAREVAMGGAYRALGTTAVSVDGNPAALGLVKLFQVDVGGAWDPANKSSWYVGGFVRDSQTSVLSAGYSFQFLSTQLQTPTGPINSGGFQQVFALALPLADYMTAGVSTHWITWSDLHINAASLDAGVAFKLGTVATLGVAGHNLINTNHPLELGRYFDLSAGLHLGPVVLAVDGLTNFGPDQFHPKLLFGTELNLAKVFFFRAGFDFYSRTNLLAQQWYVTTGFGFAIDKGGLDFGYRQSVSERESLLVCTLRIVL